MQIRRRRFRLLFHQAMALTIGAAVLGINSGQARAGSFTTDFTSTTGYTVTGTGTLPDGSNWTPVVVNGALMLTTNLTSLTADVILDDLDNGQAIDSFTARFKLKLGPGTATPADGVSFAFGPDVNSGSNFTEEGPGGPGDLVVEFDTYLNTGLTPPDSIGIDVKVSGVEIATHPMSASTLVDSQMHDVFVQLNPNGTLNVSWAGQTIYTNLALSGWAPVNGQFGIGARTGGLSQEADLANLSITTTLAGATAAPAITTQPLSQTINESSNVTFTVAYTGTPPFTFQWNKNGTAITDATNSVLTLTNVSAADTGAKYTVTLSNAQNSVTSQPATLTVTPDLTAPTIVSATASNDFRHVTLVFSKPITQASAEAAANYQINGLTVSSAVLSTNDNQTVVLTTSSQTPGTAYTITVNNIKDTRGSANTIAANSTVNFTLAPITVASVSALGETNKTVIDVGVTFTGPVDPAIATNAANYKLSAGTIMDASYFTNSFGVVLRTTGLTAGSSYTLTVTNLQDLGGNKVTGSTQPFTVSTMQWGEVGADQLGLGFPNGYGVVAVSTNGFDVYSDGYGEWNNYDETTFVYEQITGDFDKQVRVEYQDPSSQWARAGLVARDVTNFGVDAATQTGDPSGTVSQPSGSPPFPGTAGRYQKIHVNPVGPTLTGPGTPGNASWEGNRRLDTGGPSSTALTGQNAVPQYPNAWCRLQRKGQTFTIYRSDDGVNWVNVGATTWPDPNDPSATPMPDTLYVGPEYSPENGNITDPNSRGRFLAKFRDYGNTGTTAGGPSSITAARTANGISLTFKGTLQSATNILGPWTPVTGASPLVVPTTGKAQFFRVK